MDRVEERIDGSDGCGEVAAGVVAEGMVCERVIGVVSGVIGVDDGRLVTCRGVRWLCGDRWKGGVNVIPNGGAEPCVEVCCDAG